MSQPIDDGNGSARRATAPAPAAADIAVVAALSIEVGHLVDKLRRVRTYQAAKLTVTEGELGGKIIVVIVSGAGRSAARRAVDLAIVGHQPRMIISAGFAGALAPDLERNQLVVPNEVIDLENHRYVIDPPAIADALPSVSRGRLVTVDQIMATISEKQSLRQATEADLVDMETSAVAGTCLERMIPFVPIRVISDDARTELPREVGQILTQTASYRVGFALRAIWKRPSSLKDFWALHEHALEASDRLAETIAHYVEALP